MLHREKLLLSPKVKTLNQAVTILMFLLVFFSIFLFMMRKNLPYL
jgi:hypothetical protein